MRLRDLALIAFILGAAVPAARGHGNMVWPPVWQDKNATFGLEKYSILKIGGYLNFFGDPEKTGNILMWYSNIVYIPDDIEPSLPDYMRTWANTTPESEEHTARHPWKAPGSAPVFAACGVAGGNPLGCPVGEPIAPGMDCEGGGWSYGPRAEDMEFEDIPITVWERGSTQEVAWLMDANHGGGYSYRLCKIPPEGRSGLTEECFQQGHLSFAGPESWIQYGYNETTRKYFTANRTTEGTYPPGSEWTKNPVANCAPNGGFFIRDSEKLPCPDALMFEPALPELVGQGFNAFPENYLKTMFDFNIMDEVVVPADLEVGEYALSFRWDCEETPQVWNACSSIIVV